MARRNSWIRPTIEGAPQVQTVLENLPDALAKRIVQKALIATAKPIAKRAKSLAAARIQGGGSDVVSKIKVRGQRNARRAQIMALIEAGGPLAHLLEFGTAPRYQKSGKYVGQGPALRFMTDAFNEMKGIQHAALAQELATQIEREVRRLAARGLRL